MTHITWRLTAKNGDQLRNPTLGNRVWATFTFYESLHYSCGREMELLQHVVGGGVVQGRNIRHSAAAAAAAAMSFATRTDAA